MPNRIETRLAVLPGLVNQRLLFMTADDVPNKRSAAGAGYSGDQGPKISVSFTRTAFGGDHGSCQANSDANTKPYKSRSFGRLRDHPVDSERICAGYVRGYFSLQERQGFVQSPDQPAFHFLPIPESPRQSISGRNRFEPFPGAPDRRRRN